MGRENENHWALHGDTYMKGAWVMHTLRSVINNDKIWFEILKEFMIENAKGFANTRDFFDKVNENRERLLVFCRTIFLYSKYNLN